MIPQIIKVKREIRMLIKLRAKVLIMIEKNFAIR